MSTLFGSKSVVSPLTNEDITNNWVVLKPEVVREVFKAEYQIKASQVVKAEGGFGCKGGALSTQGGKVFYKSSDGFDGWCYRNEILGWATPETLNAVGIELKIIE